MRKSVLVPSSRVFRGAPSWLDAFFDILAEWPLMLLVILVPLTYWPGHDTNLEFAKQAVLVAGVFLSLVAWLARSIRERKMVLRSGAINLAIIAFVAVMAISALSAPGKYLGLVGGYRQDYQSLLTNFAFAAYFFCVVNISGRWNPVRHMVFTAIVVGGLISTLSLLRFVGVNVLPGINGIDLIGLVGGAGCYAAATVVLSAGYLLGRGSDGRERVKRIAVGIAGIAAFMLVFVIDFWPVWLVIVAGLAAILIFSVVRPEAVPRLNWLAVPMVLALIAVVMCFVYLPLPISAPTEYLPSYRESFKVTQSTLTASPAWGSGPGTWSSDYALYRGAYLNQGSFWNTIFDRSSSYVLTLAATTGWFGVLSWAALIAIGMWKGIGFLVSRKKSDAGEWPTALMIFSAWVALVAATAAYGATLSSLFLFWLLLALAVRALPGKESRIDLRTSPRARVIVNFVLAAVAIAACIAGVTETRRYVSERNLASAASAQTVDAGVRELEKALAWNGMSDYAARSLARGYRVKMRETADDSSLSQEDRVSRLKDLIDKAVAAAKLATRLSPKEAANWMTLGDIYGTVSPMIPGAQAEAVKAYDQAHALNPISPEMDFAIGSLHLAAARQAMEGAVGKDDAASADAKKIADESLLKAEESFKRSLSLKSDYAEAAFGLADAYAAQGKKDDAAKELEAIRAGFPQDPAISFRIGVAYFEAGLFDKALAELARTLSIDPKNVGAHWIRERIFVADGKLDEAITETDAILGIDPGDAQAQATLKQLQNLKGSPEKAK